MKSFVAAVAASVLLAGSAAAQQNYPTKNISIVVPFGTGASVDLMARSLADYMTSKLGQTVLVVNQPGAAGNIGAAAVARAQPDGYTILFATTGPAINNKFMYKDLSYDSEKDFEPIALVATAPTIITAKPDAPFKTLKEMVEYAKKNPDKLNAGYPGNGTVGHITGELISQSQNLKVSAVQFKGTGEIITNLLGGHIDIAIDSMAPYVSQVQGKRVIGLAMGGRTRFPGLPDVPTIAEAGFPGLEASVFYALLAPRGTPANVIEKLNTIANDYLKTPAAVELFGKAGLQASQSTPATTKKYIADEGAKWGPVIKKANISF